MRAGLCECGAGSRANSRGGGTGRRRPCLRLQPRRWLARLLLAAAVAAQGSYDSANFTQMSNQLTALGYSGTIDSNALKTGITVSITNSDGSTKDVVFKLGN